MGTKFLSTKGTKDFKNQTWCNFVFVVDKNLRAGLWIAILFAFFVGGCKSTASSTSRTATEPQPSRPMQALSPLDPCPERLQDLAGALLNFMSQYNRLPPSLEDLPPIKPSTPLALTCPLSNQKYIYNPNGIKIPSKGWAVVYDASPAHSNYRWAIVFAEPKQAGHAPVPTVVAIGEAEFKAASELPGFSK
jgi:hypothetical protein